jgi:hypothetical protein
MRRIYPRLTSVDTFTGHGPYARYEDRVEVSKGKYEKLNKKWRDYFKDELNKQKELGDILRDEIRKEINREVLRMIYDKAKVL